MSMVHNKSIGEDLSTSLICGEMGFGFTVAGCVFMFIILISCFLGNILICVAVLKFSYLQSSSEHFIFSLAISDIMAVVLVLPFDIIYWITFPRWSLGGYVCNLWNSLFFMVLTALVLNLTCISFDRFLAVVFPLRYSSLMTPKLTRSMIAVVWVYSFTVGILIFLLLEPPEDGTYNFDLSPVFHGYLLIGNVLFPFVIMVILYSNIYTIARYHAKRTQTMSSNTQLTTTFARELRLAKTLGIVVLCFVICWLPFEIINVIILLEEGVENCALEIADTIACWLAYLHSALNPFLYAFCSAEFRRAFKNLVTRRDPSANFDVHAVSRQSRHGERNFENNNDPRSPPAL